MKTQNILFTEIKNVFRDIYYSTYHFIPLIFFIPKHCGIFNKKDICLYRYKEPIYIKQLSSEQSLQKNRNGMKWDSSKIDL